MKTLEIKIEIPDDVSEEEAKSLEAKAKEAAILSLWQDGKISTRKAAKALDLTYYDFLDLLTERGIPVLTKGPNKAGIGKFECSAARARKR